MLRVFRIRVLRSAKSDEVTGEWRDRMKGSFMICGPHKICDHIKNAMDGACGVCGEGERYVQDFVGETRGKKTLRRPKRRWENNIKMDLQDLG
jgi:hypothetical protein